MISVVMPAYNTERFVGDAIASVLSQDVGELELIAVDDGSTDGTLAVLEEWAGREPRVTVLRSERNEGITAALRKGIAAARGEYVVLHDSDDVSLPGRLARQRAALEVDRDAVMITGWADLIDVHGRRVGEARRARSAEALTYLLHFRNVVGGLGRVMLRRDALLAAGLGDTQLAVDYELWRRVLRHGKLLLLPEVVLLYRVHEGGVTVRRKEQQRRDARTVSRRMLDALLGRELTDEEHAAVAAVWGDGEPVAPRVAHRVLREALARFNGSPDAVRRIRRETARRWTRATRVLVKRGKVVEAVHCLTYALCTVAPRPARGERVPRSGG
jgi:glycosyltransferase involved in cell wall biosynthesis